ncbi:MAG: TPM domain-containing protein [Actinomycetota bacterium]|nr:TPM domain-containing protein [Actinomycetota bacterium]
MLKSRMLKLKKSLVIFLLFFLSFLIILSGCSNSNEKVYDINLPSYTGYINDYTGKLDIASRDSLEALSSRIEKETGCEIAVAIVENLQGLTEEEYAVKLFEKWGIGKEKEDNGILILIGTEGEQGNRPLRIEVGYGLEGVITDLEAGRIRDEILIPELVKGNFYYGLYNTIIAIADQIYTDKGMAPLSSSEGIAPLTIEKELSEGSSIDSGTETIIFFLFISVIVIIAFIIIPVTKLFQRKCPKCRRFKLRTISTILKTATYTEAGRQLVKRTCLNCGYNDTKEVIIPRRTRYSSYRGGGRGMGGGRSSGGGFGGFGGGSSGGGGASGKW